MLISARLGARRTPWVADRCGSWKAATPMARCALFVLGAFAAGLTAIIFNLMHVPEYLFTTGLVLTAISEWFIQKRRLFGAGIEEALGAAGLLMIALEAARPFIDPAAVRTPFLVAAALAVAGFRLLNPLLTTLSVLALSFAMESLGDQRAGTAVLPASIAGAFCFAVAAAALLAGRVRFNRPSYDRMLDWLVVTMPLAGYLWLQSKNPSGLTLELLRASPFRSIPLMTLVALGAAALVIGVRRRAHAPIIGFLICAASAGYELRHLTNLSIHAKLIGWGSVVLLAALGLDRYLRTPRRGISSRRLDENEGSFDLLQLAGAGAIAPQSVQPPGAPFKGGGGAGGGGGASQSY